ncbi:hypothetical protein OCU04_004966 [Sclerotinia nivalis]|uniref:Ankyrin repeat protein n=1 Tax=Sclerotinia nivalis TaxID=352851 RepID=A0A9X0AN74_9HELO|nr:hypothetical protein OCU04_004966 [Sclerotinia nivalis]
MVSSLMSITKIYELPQELVCLLFDQILYTVGPVEALKLCTVSNFFNNAILSAICLNYVNDSSGPVNNLIKSLVFHRKHVKTHLMGHFIHAQIKKEPEIPILSPINRTIQYICQHSSQTDEQVSQMSYQICKTIANRLCWKEDGTLDFSTNFYRNSSVPTSLDTDDAYHALSAAIVAGNIEIFRSLLSSIPNIKLNVDNEYFGRPLHLSALWGRTEFVHILLAMGGADPGFIQQIFSPWPRKHFCWYHFGDTIRIVLL